LTSIQIRARLQPTEDPEKVSKSIHNVFGDIPLKKNGREISGRLEGINSLQAFKNIIHRDRIRDTLRNVFRRWGRGDRLGFGLNRQAAFSGHVSLNLQNEDPMGPIEVEIRGDIEKVIQFLCSKR
jgi:predicted RNA binding protein with dsRBD fold (UPF0201 family)